MWAVPPAVSEDIMCSEMTRLGIPMSQEGVWMCSRSTFNSWLAYVVLRAAEKVISLGLF